VNLKFNIDAAAIAEAFKDLAMEVEQDLEKGIANLAVMTDAAVKEMVQNELHSSRETYLENLSLLEVSPGIWVVSLDQPALWIEEGIPEQFDMKPGLLKDTQASPTTGRRHKVIPFEHSKAPSKLTPYAQNVVDRIKRNLKKDKINFKKLEVNDDGSPKRGLLHTKNYGGETPGKGNTPVMEGVSIYQSVTKTGNVRRDILTFRTVSDGPNQKNKWIHPGLDAKKFMDKAFEWAMKEWEDTILPEILAKYSDE
jgi:hypothetical protein